MLPRFFRSMLAIVMLSISTNLVAQNFVDVKPSPQQLEWQDMKFGVIIHFGANTVAI